MLYIDYLLFMFSKVQNMSSSPNVHSQRKKNKHRNFKIIFLRYFLFVTRNCELCSSPLELRFFFFVVILFYFRILTNKMKIKMDIESKNNSQYKLIYIKFHTTTTSLYTLK